MNWKTKSRIQRAIAALPSSVSYAAYYLLQRKFGDLKRFNPMKGLAVGVETWKHIRSLGLDPSEKTFFEIGTGWVPIVPIAYWLMGAKHTFTIDLNPYLKDELIHETIMYIIENNNKIEELLFPHIDRSRLREIAKLRTGKTISSKSVLELCHISYIAPGDAAKSDMEDESIDFHTSNAVFEHIPFDVLKGIIMEGNRITKRNGLFVHRIDYSDHYSHSDQGISTINFLHYSDSEWDRYAGNRFMYMNRLRHDDYVELFKSSGHLILIDQPRIDQCALNLLRSGEFRLSEKFRAKSNEALAVHSAWLITKQS